MAEQIPQRSDLPLGAETGPEAAKKLGITPIYNQARLGALQKEAPLGGPRSLYQTKSHANIITSSSMQRQFKGFTGEMESRGFRIDPKTTGGYNPQSLLPGGIPSEHARGNALDVNWNENPFAKGGANRLPMDVGYTAHKWGLSWGGYFTGEKKDTMHFEGAQKLPEKELKDLERQTKFQNERIERAPNFQERQLRMSRAGHDDPHISRPTGPLGFPREQVEHPHLAPMPPPQHMASKDTAPKSNPGTTKRASTRSNPATTKRPHSSHPATSYE